MPKINLTRAEKSVIVEDIIRDAERLFFERMILKQFDFAFANKELDSLRRFITEFE